MLNAALNSGRVRGTQPATEPQTQNADALREATDEQLLAAYRKNGHRELFSELVRRYERELYSYLRRYLQDPEMAEDAFQGTFLQVHLKCDQYEPGRRVKPWLYTIATNQAIDARRRNKRHQAVSLDRTTGSADSDPSGKLADLLVSEETGPANRVDQMERRDQVRDAVADLPDSLQKVVHLVYYQGLKYREAADALGIPVGTVKSRLHAAVGKLGEAFRDGLNS